MSFDGGPVYAWDSADPPGLTFDTFRETNLARCKRWHEGFPEADTWSLADWSNAVCGEAGELANVVKKIRRHETGHKPGALDPTLDELHAMAANEIGDVFAYLDLIATRLGLRLEDCAREKFNAVSVREGHPERLPSVNGRNASCDCPVNAAGDIRCHVCGEYVNVRCWRCRTPRAEGPCPTGRTERPRS